jgi:hypothetical protein
VAAAAEVAAAPGDRRVVHKGVVHRQGIADGVGASSFRTVDVMDALVAVEERVRDGVRARGIDPLVEPDVVRDLVDDAVADVVAEWVSRDLDLTHQPVDIARRAFDAVAGFPSSKSSG